MKEHMMSWRFRAVYVPGKDNGGPDCLSRRGLDLPETKNDILEEEAAEEVWNKKMLRSHLFNLLSSGTEREIEEIEIDEDEDVLATTTRDVRPLLWEEVKKVSLTDQTTRDVVRMIKLNLSSKHAPNPEVTALLKFRHNLGINEGVLLYKGRIVIPQTLRPRALEILHAAHQGKTSMNLRAEESIFWPGMTLDIAEGRRKCRSCDRDAPSQSRLPPYNPVVPEYPFQHICADYLEAGGRGYGVIVDRFSNWFQLYVGKGGSATFISILRRLISDFNIPESLTTDGGKQYTAEETQAFLKTFGIKHRVCSVANPHANSRAELAVKTAKRLLRDNVGINGLLNTDSMTRALMVYRNTPDRDTGMSPAELLMGRKLKGFLPSKVEMNPLQNRNSLHQGWKQVADWRELALAKRSSKAQAEWSQKSKKLPPLKVGDHVMVQNQLGNSPRKWEKRGVVVEVRPFDQYWIRMDGSRNLTLRNRRFLRSFQPIYPGGESNSWRHVLDDSTAQNTNKRPNNPPVTPSTSTTPSPAMPSTLYNTPPVMIHPSTSSPTPVDTPIPMTDTICEPPLSQDPESHKRSNIARNLRPFNKKGRLEKDVEPNRTRSGKIIRKSD